MSAFPAGDESDGSSDEWDIGYSDKNIKPCAEVNVINRFFNTSNTVPFYICMIKKTFYLAGSSQRKYIWMEKIKSPPWKEPLLQEMSTWCASSWTGVCSCIYSFYYGETSYKAYKYMPISSSFNRPGRGDEAWFWMDSSHVRCPCGPLWAHWTAAGSWRKCKLQQR